jgi:hypothetical protein
MSMYVQVAAGNSSTLRDLDRFGPDRVQITERTRGTYEALSSVLFDGATATTMPSRS